MEWHVEMMHRPGGDVALAYEAHTPGHTVTITRWAGNLWHTRITRVNGCMLQWLFGSLEDAQAWAEMHCPADNASVLAQKGARTWTGTNITPVTQHKAPSCL